jgi:hypothetical protein
MTAAQWPSFGSKFISLAYKYSMETAREEIITTLFFIINYLRAWLVACPGSALER